MAGPERRHDDAGAAHPGLVVGGEHEADLEVFGGHDELNRASSAGVREGRGRTVRHRSPNPSELQAYCRGWARCVACPARAAARASSAGARGRTGRRPRRRDHQHAVRRLALNHEALQQRGCRRDASPPVHAQGLVNAGNQEQQPDGGSATMLRRLSMRLLPRRSGSSRVLSSRRHEAGRVAARRGVEPARADRRENAKGDASINALYTGGTWSTSFLRDASPTSPNSASSCSRLSDRV